MAAIQSCQEEVSYGTYTETTPDDAHELPSCFIRPRCDRSLHVKGLVPKRRLPSPYSSPSLPRREHHTVKLLSLSVQVLQCPTGRSTLLSPRDVVRIIGACLWVSIVAGKSDRTLLRSVAADALSHCVIVVFGMRGRTTTTMMRRGRLRTSLSREHKCGGVCDRSEGHTDGDDDDGVADDDDDDRTNREDDDETTTTTDSDDD